MSEPINVVIGRSRDCDVVLRDPTVSSRHARLVWEDDRILVEDLGSANGTFLDGRRVERARIRPGDDLRLGALVLPWSHRSLRPFLRRGGKDTVLAETLRGSRFICGSCGTRGLLPQDFRGGVLRCGACGQRLIVSKSEFRFGPLLIAGAILLAVLTVSLQIRAQNRGADGMDLPELPAAASPEEASIRVHSLERVVRALDVESSTTRNEAARIAANEEGPFRLEQVAELWSTVRSRWRYVNDPRGDEYFAKASESIDNGYVGDCDDFSILLAAMVNAIGGEARVVMMDGPQGGHAYAEACIRDESETVREKLASHYRRRSGPQLHVDAVHFRPGQDCPVWLNLDWNAGVPGGPYEQEEWAVAIYPDAHTETLAPAADAPALDLSRR